RGSHAHARTSSCSTKVRRWDNMCFASTILHLLFNQQNLRNFIDCACSTIHLNAKFASKFERQKYRYEQSPKPLPTEDILQSQSCKGLVDNCNIYN
ncbi:hypothetical protein GBAR_LOCUS3837, partial [Geodia barretti]